MLKASIAEWILRQVTSRQHASSIVGDLVEISEERGVFWFWFSLFRVAFSLAWRRPLAFVAAFYTGNWVLHGFSIAIYGVHTLHRAPSVWGPVFNILSAAGTLLWIAAIYAAIRFDLRDDLARLSIVAAGLVTAAILFWWQPAILFASLATGACVSWYLLSVRRHRRVLIALCGVVITGFAGGMLSLFLESKIQHFIYPGLVGSRELQEHPSIMWAGLCCYMLATWIVTSSCAFAHRRIARNESADSEGAMTPAG